MSLTEEEKEQLEKLVGKMDSGEAKRFGLKLATRTLNVPQIPAFHWNSNLKAFKAAMKITEKASRISDEDILKGLKSRGLVSPTARVDNYGYTYNETGIFIEDEGMVSLTEIGTQIAKLFNDEENLNIVETIICRGLQQQSAGYTYLSILAEKPGIFRQDVVAKMMSIFGRQGKYYAGYYTNIFSQLGLIEKSSEDGKARYWLTVPRAWSGKPPESPIDSD